MDWLRDSTKNWKLKTSLILYMVVSLLFSAPFGGFCRSILKEARKIYILSKTLSNSNSFIDKIMFSQGFTTLIDGIPVLLVLLFFYIFFQLFYKHKIQSTLDYLDNYEERDIKDKNELSDKVFELSQENIKIKKENFINIRKMNEISKKMDTNLHEIKNPLTILSGDIEMLSTIFKSDDDRVKRILSRMSRSEKRIQDYINHIKTSENIKDLAPDIKPISINNLLNIIQAELNHWTSKISFTYDLKDFSQTIQLDSELFIEGLINILKNSDSHAKSQISLHLYENESYYILEIEDDGPGFSLEALLNYNQPYFSENPLVSNMGLGLYITDEIMKKLGIEMVLSNHLGANIKLFLEKS